MALKKHKDKKAKKSKKEKKEKRSKDEDKEKELLKAAKKFLKDSTSLMRRWPWLQPKQTSVASASSQQVNPSNREPCLQSSRVMAAAQLRTRPHLGRMKRSMISQRRTTLSRMQR